MGTSATSLIQKRLDVEGSPDVTLNAKNDNDVILSPAEVTETLSGFVQVCAM